VLHHVTHRLIVLRLLPAMLLWCLLSNHVSADGLGSAGRFGAAAAGLVTVATRASAFPNLVLGTTTTLSVLGGNAGKGGEHALIYRWRSTGPGPVTFSPNGTNAAKSTTATFVRGGSYILVAAVVGPRGSTPDWDNGAQATSRVIVIVNQTLSSVVLAPGPILTLTVPATQQFIAKALDQFGRPLATQPPFTWSFLTTRTEPIDMFGSITTNGLYTTGGKPGIVKVKALTGGIFSTVLVALKPAPITLVAPAAASPNPVTVNTTNLSVDAAYAGYGFLSYLWSGTGPGSVTFFPNGTYTSKSPYAVFTQAGVYTITVIISNGFNVKTSSVDVTVNANLGAITVTPGPTLTLTHHATQQFTATATDQFGQALSPQPKITWSLPAGGVGSIDSATGLYNSGNDAGAATVTATSGAVSGTCAVTVN
jgi:hypothetical protein